MKVQFYVYGVPKGFDLYGGKPDDIAYYQNYYDGSKENSKLTLHRRNNGQVVYSYLRYNLVDSDGRPGAFFGISTEFNGTYCTDITSLYELFEEVYKTILQHSILLKIANNQTIFGVRALIDAENEITRITGILQKNLESAFVNDFLEIDTSFKQNVNEDKVCKLNPEKGNDTILQVSKEFPMLSVSPEYKGADDFEKRIPPEDLKALDLAVLKIKQENALLQTESQNITALLGVRNTLIDRQEQIKVEKDIIERYGEFNKSVRDFFSKYNNAQKQIQQYLLNQKEHPVLLDLLQKFENGKNALTKLQEPVLLISPAIKQFGGIGQSVFENVNKKDTKTSEEITVGKNSKTFSHKSKNIWLIFIKKNKYKALIVSALILAVYAFFLIKMKSDKISSSEINCAECTEFLNKGFDFLKKNRFNDAITEYKKAEAKGIDVTENIDEVNKQAAVFYTQKAYIEFNDTNGRKKFESYKAAIAQLNKALQYSFEVNKLADFYKKSTINYYFDEINKPNQPQSKKKEYADYILQIDSNNEGAKKIINPPVNKIANNTTAKIKQTDKKCIKSYTIASGILAKDYSPEELYEELKKYPETSYQVIIDGCTKIEKSCATKTMKENVKKWREEAEKKKREQPQPH